MPQLYYKALPYNKEDVTLALESGVDGLIVPDEMAESARTLARIEVYPESAVNFVAINEKEDEHEAARLAALRDRGGQGAPALVVLEAGWEIIPLENLLAASSMAVEVRHQEEAVVAAGVLERGADALILRPEDL